MGAILLSLSTAFLIITGYRVMRGQADLRMGGLVAPRSIAMRRLALFVLTLSYIFCIDWLGFTITTFLFIFFGMLLLSGRERANKRLILVLSAGLSVGGYLLFVVAFQRRFPEGPFEQAFKAIVAAAGGG